MPKYVPYFTVTLLLLCIYSSVFSQQTLRGIVLDEKSQKPIPGAHLSVRGTAQGTVSDENGVFVLNVSKQDVILTISSVGYEVKNVSAKAGENLTVLLKNLELMLNEVTVSAFEAERTLLETPASVGRISARDISRFGLLSPQQSLSTIPGVKVESTTIGRYSLRIRGGNLGVVAHTDNYKSYWNGIPITFADGFSPLAYFDFGSVSSASIIRGPSGSIYGAGLSGVALYENKTPANLETSLQTEALLGSYGAYRYSLTLATGGEKGDLRLQYSKIHTDGYREESASDNRFVNLFARVFPSEKQTISFTANYMERDYGIPGNINAEQVAENPRQSRNSPEFDNGITGHNLMIGAAHEYRWNTQWENTTSFSYQMYEGTFLIGTPFFKIADRGITTTFSMRSATAYSFKAFSGFPARFVFGGEFTRGINEINDYSDGFESTIFSSRGTIDRSALAFAQLEMELPAAMTMTLGGSFNNFYVSFEERLLETGIPRFTKEVNDLSPRIALVKKLKENLYLQGNISKGFSPPPRGAIDNDGFNTNENLESAKGLNKEIGIRGTFMENRISLDLVYYHLDETDVIVPRITSNADGLDRIMNENAGAIRRQGIELSTEYMIQNDPSKALSLAKIWSSYTYMDHQFETYNTIVVNDNNESFEVSYNGKNIPGIHPHTVVLGLDLYSRIGFYINNTFSYYGSIYLNNANTDKDDAYNLLDIRAGYRRVLPKNMQLDIYGGANNILDDDYNSMHGLNASFGAYYDPAPKRNFYGGVSVKYNFK
ncbi:iron complex outermembrane receptor protein [Algoriphagus sp. 4150]|uniref:TonB-dependent receptor n=1 Tax=Algoriphagus sp. 4150 TaxID=2817756 RepID=UPI002866FCE8|nr:TonB-dependent receptor [Algoriphagus sp. 4150]MDR7132217.1 iron complex outermembrane receptor protein [Algoriphagus sp. 4150]